MPDEDYDVMKQRGVHVETVEQAGHSMAWENPQGLAIAVPDVWRHSALHFDINGAVAK